MWEHEAEMSTVRTKKSDCQKKNKEQNGTRDVEDESGGRTKKEARDISIGGDRGWEQGAQI